MKRFQCDECGCGNYLDREGSGTDTIGDFTDFVCDDCGHITRIYDEHDNNEWEHDTDD